MKKLSSILITIIVVAIIIGSLIYFYFPQGSIVSGTVTLMGIDLYAYPERASETETPIEVVMSINNSYPISLRIRSGELRILVDNLELVKATIPSQTISQGINMLVINAVLSNMLIDEFWYQHLSRAERSGISLEGSITFETPLGGIALPVIYATTVKTSLFPIEQSLDREYDLDLLGKVIARNIRVELKDVTPYETYLKASVTIENNLRMIPLYVEGLVFRIRTEGMTVLGKGEQVSGKAIAPGETDTVMFDVIVENAKVPRFWYEHIKNKERTTIYIEVWLRVKIAGRIVELFKERPLIASTKFETSIFKYKENT